MTTIHYDIADAIISSLPPDSPLRAVLTQTSSAYGRVAGALEDLIGASIRGQDTRREMSALIAAIHAPRAEGLSIAGQLYQLGRDAASRRYRREHP